jgi:hypothetical protein
MFRHKIKGTVHPLLCDSALEFTGERHAEEMSEPRSGQKASWHLQVCDTKQVQVKLAVHSALLSQKACM